MNDDKLELTPWFPVSITPVRDGVYMVKAEPPWHTADSYSYWDGAKFNWISGGSPDEAMSLKAVFGAGDQVSKWRGLAKEPK